MIAGLATTPTLTLLDRIVQRVALYYGVGPANLIGPRRWQSLIVPRHVAMYLARQLTRCSYEEIGAHLGGRNHTTVMHGCRMIAERMQADEELRGRVAALTHEITSEILRREGDRRRDAGRPLHRHRGAC